jgi:hypothetical protein
MKGYQLSSVSPQQKIVAVNNKFGNTNIKNQQGTTRVLFDTLPLDGRTQFRFFENVNLRQFPLTNLTSEGNRLGVGEAIVIQKIYFTLLFIDPDTGAITSYWPFTQAGPTTPQALNTGDLDIIIANSTVMKDFTVMSMTNQFNPSGVTNGDEAYGTQTDIVIPPLLEYLAVLKTTTYATSAFYNHIRISFEGTAGIIAPQTTF